MQYKNVEIHHPITVFGSSISYFTGKLENYLRLKGVPYQHQALTGGLRKSARKKLGVTQIPAVQLDDDTWMTDTTPMIQWFENQIPANPIIPLDPLQRFFSLMLEDYADEWLWRPAMHYRWYYKTGAHFAGTHLAIEMGVDVPAPIFLKRLHIIYRQRHGYTTGDGITKDQVPQHEAIFLRTLAQLQAIFEARPFLLGDSPSLADIAFAGPFFRHFALDPVPAEIIRRQAPAVYEWVSRLWNAGIQEAEPNLLQGIPADWGPILKELGEHYLPYLCTNVEAVKAGKPKFDANIGGIHYKGALSSRYRVWCLQQLRNHYYELDEGHQHEAKTILEAHNCWEPLWRSKDLPIEAGFCEQLPFYADAKMTDVYIKD